MKAPGSRVLRRGSAADLEAMFRLDVLCFAEPFRFSRDAMRRFATRKNAGVYVVEGGGEQAGFVIVQVEGGGTVGYVVTLDVRPEMRREGVARQLMEAAERHAREAGAAQMMLHVYAGNAGAVAFYERAGYERLGMEAEFYGVGMDAWVYGKGLG